MKMANAIVRIKEELLHEHLIHAPLLSVSLLAISSIQWGCIATFFSLSQIPLINGMVISVVIGLIEVLLRISGNFLDIFS